MSESYLKEYQESIDKPEQFWQRKAKALSWFEFPQNILSRDNNGVQRWFADGTMNTSFMAIDHHVNSGRGDQAAIIYDSPASGSKRTLTYKELLSQVANFAGVLKSKGVKKGDRVLIYMPMIPEAAIAMLACARLGAIHSVVFGGFAANELAVRIDDAQPKVIVSASCGLELNKVIEYKPLLNQAIDTANYKPDSVIVAQREHAKATLDRQHDCDWDYEMQSAVPADAVPVKGSDPLYILYTSGTTGAPKGVVRDNGGHAVALNYTMHALYNVKAGDTFWAASDVGWVVGHSYIVYGPLLAGCSTVMYEGKPIRSPDAGAFWRVCEEYKVKVLFAAPTAFRAIKKEDPNGALIQNYNLSHLDTIFMAGERLDPPTYEWTTQKTSKPVIDHWWQTETGWAICGNYLGFGQSEIKAGSATYPSPGFDVKILNANGDEVDRGHQGAIAIKLPLPPGCLPTIWGDHQRFTSSYLTEYPGYYCSGDGGYIDEDGYVFVMGRTDDVINVAGHRLSTGEMEEVVAAHQAVAECSVIGIKCNIKGQLPVGLVILKDGATIEPQVLQEELTDMINQRIGRIACFKQALIVPRLPKTRSGKILRNTLRQMADGIEYKVPSTIDDPSSLQEIEALMHQKGLV